MLRLLAAFTIATAVSISSFAQLAPPPPRVVPAPPKVDPQKVAERLAKQVTLSEQVLSEVPGLRLGENRAHVYAKVGVLLWKSDQKTAKELFQRSVNDLLNVQMLAEADEKNRQNGNDLRTIQSIRPPILTVIGTLDAEFALESLYRTRTGAIQRALAQASEQPGSKIGDTYGNSGLVAQTELTLEQRLIRMAAEQNPERAAKLLQESIKKGLSNETLSLLRKLYEKDSELADSLAAETLDKLLSTTFPANPADQGPIGLSYSILNDSLRVRRPDARELTFAETGIRSLANKVINYAMSAGQNMRFRGLDFPTLIKFAEKYSPAMVAALKKLEKANMPPGANVPDSDTRKLMESSMTPAQMLAEAKKLPAESRSPVYQNAANRMSQTGEYNAALELLNSNFTGKALENAINSLNWWYASHLMNQSKWAEAERLIDEMPESNRRSALISLATRAFAKDPNENKTYALSVLQKVRGLLADKPSDQNELSQFIQLTSAYAPIEPTEAFGTFEPVIPMLNELSDASAVVQGFQNPYSIRSGEFVMANNNSYGFYFDQNLIRSLAKADFERAIKLIDTFTRREFRISLKLQLAETGLN